MASDLFSVIFPIIVLMNLGNLSFSLSIKSEHIILVSSCCEFPNQFDCTIEKRKRENDLIVTIPEHLVPPKYRNQTVKLSFQNRGFSCPNGNTSHEISLQADQSLIEDFALKGREELVQFLPYNDYFKHGSHNFHPKDYCINLLSKHSIEVVSCNPECSQTRPCIKKCCDLDEVWDASKYPRVKCSPVKENLWNARIFSSVYDTESLNESITIPHIITYHPREWFNSSAMSMNLKALRDIDTDKRGLFKALPNGNIWMKMNRLEWGKLPKDNFCIDGGKMIPSRDDLDGFNDPKNLDSDYSGSYTDTMILFCGAGCSEEDNNYCEAEPSQHLYGISLLLSSGFMLLTIIVYFILLWEKQNVHGWTTLCYFASLFFMYLFTGIIQFGYLMFNESESRSDWADWGCYAIALATHYFWLSTFTWMSAVNFDLWWTFRALRPTGSRSKGIKRFMIYVTFSMGIPLSIVSTGITLDQLYKDDLESNLITPDYAVRRCFMENKFAPLPFLYGPISILLTCNLIFFIATVYDMHKIRQSTKFAAVSSSKSTKQKQSILLFFKLFLLMGIPWLFEAISWAASSCGKNAWYWTVFDMINIFQSVAIFFTFVCKSDTKKVLESKFPALQNFLSVFSIQPEKTEAILNKRPGLKFILKPFTRERKSRRTFSSGKTHSTTLTEPSPTNF